MLYLTPNYATATGSVLALHRRKGILSLAIRYSFLVMENDAYGELFFGEPSPPSPFALADEEERQWIVHASSFSESLAPGLWVA